MLRRVVECFGWNRVHLSRASKKTSNAQPDVYIFYGSQTGTTEGYARRLATQAQKRNVQAMAMSLSQFNVHKSTQYSTVIFVVASYGTGGPTDDATSFYNWLKTSLKPDLSHMQYTVFGCGNSDYTDSYNGMAKFVDAKIGAFGATRFFDLSLGDAAGEIDHLDNDYDAWEGRVLDVVAPMATADTTSSTTTTISATAQRTSCCCPSVWAVDLPCKYYEYTV
ncbi:hypothetical protein DYB37_011045 [Aphanomyces astaci]|uniref:Flavodoxin-like domain-containing protein n=1 Tax=Aphanomyces astaci TaxID=112090 RepID=A0A418FBM4_APHAT|nr:hypothetical protein DYB37_011045 [Aphanomyces astaci]